MRRLPVEGPVLTPWEERTGRWYKREDLHRHPSGVNGGKWRQCQWLISRMRGDVVVTGASVLSPQHAMTAVAASEAGKQSVHYIGGTTLEKALRHPSPALAAQYGAHFRVAPVGYNPQLQRRVRRLADVIAGEILRYGVTPDPRASVAELTAFHMLGALQTMNMPGSVQHLIVPFGSGNSAASVLYGFSRGYGPRPGVVHLVEIGPDRREWLARRLHQLGVYSLPFELRFHRTDYSYGDRVRLTVDEIPLHPTYEAKVAQWCYAHEQEFPGWGRRDGSCALWIVGGALPEVAA